METKQQGQVDVSGGVRKYKLKFASYGEASKLSIKRRKKN